MRWYRPIQCDNTVSDPLVCEKANFQDFDYFGMNRHVVARYFFQGKPIDNWNDGLVFTTDKAENDGTPDDVLQNAYGLPIFSNNLVNHLTENRIEGFQFLPVTVLTFQGKSMYRYYIANCINIIPALDFEKSIYHRFPEDFVNPEARGKIVCQKIVLRTSEITVSSCFRLFEQPNVLLVSEKFVKAFRGKKYTGYSFQAIHKS